MSTHEKKLLSSFLILSFLLQVFVEASLDIVDEDGEVAALYHKSHKSKINCPYACARRCRKSSRKNVCTRACGTCCMRCKCVPPGTYGNKSTCPCYAKLKTHGHRPKCP